MKINIMRQKSALTIPFVILCLMPLMIQCKIEESPNSLDTYSAKKSKQDSAINQNTNNNERDYGDILELNDDFQPIGEQDGDGAIKQFVSNDEHKKLFAGYRESYITRDAANKFRQRIREHKKPYTDRDYDDLLHDITVKPKRIIYDKKYFDYLPAEVEEEATNESHNDEKNKKMKSNGVGGLLVLDNDRNNYMNKDMKNENKNDISENKNNNFNTQGSQQQQQQKQQQHGYKHHPGSRVNSRRFRRDTAAADEKDNKKALVNGQREKRQGYYPSTPQQYNHEMHNRFQQREHAYNVQIEPQRYYEIPQAPIAQHFSNVDPWYNRMPSSLSYHGNYFNTAPLAQSPAPSSFFYSSSFPLHPANVRPSNFYLPIPVNVPSFPAYLPPQSPNYNSFPPQLPNFPSQLPNVPTQNPNAIYPTDNKPTNNNDPNGVAVDMRFSFEADKENEDAIIWDPVRKVYIRARDKDRFSTVRPVLPLRPENINTNFINSNGFGLPPATQRPPVFLSTTTRRPAPRPTAVLPLRTTTPPPLVIDTNDDYDWESNDEPGQQSQGSGTNSVSTPPPLVHNSDDYDYDKLSRPQTTNTKDRTNRPSFSAVTPPAPTSNSISSTNDVDSSDTSRCVWAIVNCCSRSNTRIRYSCFEQIGCVGAFWDLNPCSNNVLDAAINVADQYYNQKK